MPADPGLDEPVRGPRHGPSRFAALLLAVLAGLSGCSSSSPGADRGGSASAMPQDGRAGLRTPGAAAVLSNLTELDKLGELFDAHQDVPRLILLLSPT